MQRLIWHRIWDNWSLLLRSIAWSTGETISQLIILLLVIYKFRRIHLVDLLWWSNYLLNALRSSWIKLRLIYVIIHKWVLVVLLMLGHSMRMIHAQMERLFIYHSISSRIVSCAIYIEWWIFGFSWILFPISCLNICLIICDYLWLVLWYFGKWGSRNALGISILSRFTKWCSWFWGIFSWMLNGTWIRSYYKIVCLLRRLLLILYLINLFYSCILLMLHLVILGNKLRLVFCQVWLRLWMGPW